METGGRFHFFFSTPAVFSISICSVEKIKTFKKSLTNHSFLLASKMKNLDLRIYIHLELHSIPGHLADQRDDAERQLDVLSGSVSVRVKI